MHFRKLKLLRDLKREYALELATHDVADLSDDDILYILIAMDLDKTICNKINMLLDIPETSKNLTSNLIFGVMGRVIGGIIKNAEATSGRETAIWLLNKLSNSINQELKNVRARTENTH